MTIASHLANSSADTRHWMAKSGVQSLSRQPTPSKSQS